MPTDAEFTELRTKCKWEGVTQNGVDGQKVTGPSGKSIFLPAAGYNIGDEVYGGGSEGFYWSSSLNTTGSVYSAWSVVFFDSDHVYRDASNRYQGMSVRAVRP